ncbi:MAG: hypothetical protein NXI23_05550 [Bacteroidetes bacterium]|jgi:hypothetical protein|nr:hypothetical protein [Bacteroidota bacterium]MDF1863828.1 hypothetical protein [Saprospiraceae bacterium]
MSLRKNYFFICWILFGVIVMIPNDEVLAQSKVILASNKIISTTDIPKSLERKFRRDAARLALRVNSEQEDLRYQNIIIPRPVMDDFYRILSNIYLKDETAKSIAKCNVHTFPNPSIDHFVVIFDKNVAWAEPLRQGISETSSEDINDLLDDFDLIIEKHVNWNDAQDAITIRSKEPLNMAALANEFYNIDGVAEIDLGIPKVGGNDIVVQRVGGGWEINYVLKFGSYISGNGKKHIWKYKATDDGLVQFMTEEGDEIPSWMRCNFQDDLFLVKRL